MSYKINTKENFNIITPQTANLTHKMTEDFINFSKDLIKERKSVIFDFYEIKTFQDAELSNLERIYHSFYEENLSCAFCNLQSALKSKLNVEMNIVPTLDEAIDLVSMEGLERELLGGDE